MPTLGEGGDIRYPDLLAITAAGAGTQDPVSGVWSGGKTTVYSGAAYVQDTGSVISRDPDGTPTERADAQAFLPPGVSVENILPDMPVVVTFGSGGVMQAQVARARRLDRVVFLRLTGR